jgi:omega-6 fatty acid desaturase (delta-12 desaturase)
MAGIDATASSGWAIKLIAYRNATWLRGAIELAITLIPFALAWYGMWFAVTSGYWALYLLLLVPAAGLLVRLFLIQHDCGHRAFLPNRSANDWLGRALSIITITPYDYWRDNHAIHHATSGHLGRRGIGDVDTLTVAEYLDRSPKAQGRYRFYRHPLVMFGIGPFYLFVLQNRLPFGAMRNGWLPWVSTMGTTAGVIAAGVLMTWVVGLQAFLIVHVPIVMVGAAVGVWLFYVQHQFENTYWAENDTWNARCAALHGSSHYDLPLVLRWFTANIGVHHVHHLSSQIPYYRLQKVLRDHPPLRDIGRLTLRQSLACVRLAFWDEAAQKMITLKELRQRHANA